MDHRQQAWYSVTAGIRLANSGCFVSSVVRCVVAALAVGLLFLAPVRADGQAGADSVTAWTARVQSGSLVDRANALRKIGAIPTPALPTETHRVLIAELNRLHQALQSGLPLGAPGEDAEVIGDYYMDLVGVVATLGTREAKLALVPAVAVSVGIAQDVAQLGDTAVAVLLPLLQRRNSDDAMVVLETLGHVWFWADSTGSPLSDRSRAQVLAALTTAATSGIHDDMLGMQGALMAVRDPGFLPLAQRVREFAATRGVLGHSTDYTMEHEVIPQLTTLAASRSTASLVKGFARMVTAVCGNDAAGRRKGACQSLTNDVAAASDHLANGRTIPARNGFESIGQKIDHAYADGAVTDAEHALLAGNVTMILKRLPP